MLRCMVLQEQQHGKRSAKSRRNQRVFIRRRYQNVRNYRNRWQAVQSFRGRYHRYIDIEKIEGESGTEVTFDKVICIGGDTMKVGADVAAATVTGTVMDQGKGKKVVVYHYKRKTGYHKKNGHRQLYTRVKIDKING